MKRIVITSIFLVLLLLTGSLLRDKLTFAVTYFDKPKVTSGHIGSDYVDEKAASPTSPQKSRAPEPSTLFLIVSGLGGIIVRFARRSFAQFKRGLDMFLSILGLFIASPIILASAVLIKLTSKGPVIYRQDRVGKDGEVFKIYKLRTMRIDAEKESGAVWAQEDDPRVTPIGRVLRKTHLFR